MLFKRQINQFTVDNKFINLSFFVKYWQVKKGLLKQKSNVIPLCFHQKKKVII